MPPLQEVFAERIGRLRVDPWAGDEQAPALRAALERGDTTPLAEAYADADGVHREFLVQALTGEHQPALPAIAEWPEREPGSALAWQVRGAQRITEAWAARGRAMASHVSAKAFDRFFEHLRAAETDLRRAWDLDEDDAGPWSLLLTSGRGLQLGLEELQARYARAVEICPWLVFAPDQLLQTLCRKWSGDHDTMFDFARRTVADLPVGDPRHRLVATAFVERLIAYDTPRERRYASEEPASLAEIVAAAERSALLPGYGGRPQERITMNWFAAALSLHRGHRAARPIYAALGRKHTEMPWRYFPPGTYVTYRRGSRRG